MTPERAYCVTLVPQPGGAPAIVRLRRALKTLLRMCRFRCQSVEELDPEARPKANEVGS